MATRKANGEGSIYRRSDGRWAGSAFVNTVSGQRKRIHVYARTRHEVHDRLADKLTAGRKGIRTPDKEWTVGAYLDYWLATVVAIKNRPRTAELYTSTVRPHLTPALGKIRLTKLTVQDVQILLNGLLAHGRSIRTVQQIRSVLRAALSRAEREELIVRNVAKLIDLPAWERKPIQPWSAEEASRFLAAARSHRWYAAFAMLLLYGMRRGEVLGLRWCDIDFKRNVLHITQQLQRVGKTLEPGPVKTSAGRRYLPLLDILRDTLIPRYATEHSVDVSTVAEHATSNDGLVFLSTTGTPIDPKNFVRTFHQIRAQVGLPRITVHHTRHTAATMLKNLGVPVRDAQLILGHSHVTTTQQLYQHADLDGQTHALSQIEQRVLGSKKQQPLLSTTAVIHEFSTGESAISRAFTSGGPAGDRTPDTLLKSLMLLSGSTSMTPVIRHLRTRAYAHVLGRAAVLMCCQTGSTAPSMDADIADWVVILHALRQLETHGLRQRSFPLNLLPAIHHRTSDPPPQASAHNDDDVSHLRGAAA